MIHDFNHYFLGAKKSYMHYFRANGEHVMANENSKGEKSILVDYGNFGAFNEDGTLDVDMDTTEGKKVVNAWNEWRTYMEYTSRGINKAWANVKSAERKEYFKEFGIEDCRPTLFDIKEEDSPLMKKLKKSSVKKIVEMLNDSVDPFDRSFDGPQFICDTQDEDELDRFTKELCESVNHSPRKVYHLLKNVDNWGRYIWYNGIKVDFFSTKYEMVKNFLPLEEIVNALEK